MDPDRARSWRAAGYWNDDTFGSILDRGLGAHPGLPVVVHSATHPFRGTYAEVDDLARRIAGGLIACGVKPGEPVSLQMPNWVETAASLIAIGLAGAIPVPIVHFYGAKEVGFILGQSRARVHLTVDRFGHVDMLANLEEMWPGLDALEQVFVLGETPAGTESLMTLAESDPIAAPTVGDPSEPGLVMYTSGTTADPKGVVHSHRSICFEMRQLGALAPAGSRPTLVGAPIAHGIGMLAGVLLPVWKGDPIHLIDAWDPSVVLATMIAEQVSSGMGATIFLTSLLDHPDFTPEPLDKRANTDGRPLAGCEIRLVDDEGRDVAPGTPGEIWSCGPELFLGYTDEASTIASFPEGDWYATGDIGVLDDDGYLTIVDRKRDVIIRGGANISAVEVEEVMARMPGVAEVAVVAGPDVRLGERACAFVRAVPGAEAPSLDAVKAHMESIGLARPKWPEEIRPIDDFPRTPSGKVQKFVLRQRLRDESA